MMEKKVYVLIQTYDYADDEFSLIGVFDSLKTLRKYVTVNYPNYKMDDEGDYEEQCKPDYFTNKQYLTIYETELNSQMTHNTKGK